MSGLNITAAKARAVADAIDAYDADIKVLQDGKRDAFGEVRAELEALGLDKANIRDEMAALKAAIVKRAKRRIDADAADERDALTDSYLDLIERSAPRATHAIATIVPADSERASRPSSITLPVVPPSVQSEGEAGARPEQAASEGAAGVGVVIPAQDAEFVMQSSAGEAICPLASDPAPAADAPISFLAKPYDLRPLCLNRENCGSYGSKHCGACERAARDAPGDDTDLGLPPSLLVKTSLASIGEQS